MPVDIYTDHYTVLTLNKSGSSPARLTAKNTCGHQHQGYAEAVVCRNERKQTVNRGVVVVSVASSTPRPRLLATDEENEGAEVADLNRFDNL